MKIDANRTGLDTAALQRTEKPSESAAGTSARLDSKGDRVNLSSDATLAGAAVKAANAAPEIRTALVDRMRKALAAGELGADAGKLADRLIDRMADPKA